MANDELNHQNKIEQEKTSTDKDQITSLLWRFIYWVLFTGKWIGIFLLVIIPVYLIWVNYAGERDKKRVLQKMKGQNLPMSVQELRNRMTPDEPGENGAKYYESAFKLANKLNRPPEKLQIIVVKGHPTSPELGQSLSDELRAPLSKFETENMLLFQLLDKARMYDYHAYKIPTFNTVDQMLSTALGMQGATYVLVLRALHHEMENKPDKSAKSIQDILHLANSIRYDRFLLLDLKRMGTISIAIGQYYDLLSRETLSERSLREFRHTLERSTNNFEFETAMKWQLAQGVMFLKDIRMHMAQNKFTVKSMNYNWANRLGIDKESIDEDMSWRTSSKLMWNQLWVAFVPGYHESKLARRIDARIQIIQEIKSKDNIKALNDLRKYNGSTGNEIGRLRANIAEQAGEWLKYHVKVLLTRLALAIELFHLKHRRWPSDRGEITREWFSDPYGDRPIKYRKLKNGVVVYSVGADGEDDGGIQESIQAEDKDIAFRLFDPEVRGKGPSLDPSESDPSENSSKKDK